MLSSIRYLDGRPDLTSHPDSWWIACTVRKLTFLETDYGFSLDSLELYFRGYFVTYHSESTRFGIEFEPELELLIADFRTASPSATNAASVLRIWNLLGSRDPKGDYSPHRDRFQNVQDFVCGTVAIWADGLRRLADDILRGDLSGDLPWTTE